VLERLTKTQEQFLDGLAGLTWTGCLPRVAAVLRGDVWEAFDALDRSASSYTALAPLETVVTGADGRVFAASDPPGSPPIHFFRPNMSTVRATAGHDGRDLHDRLRAP